MDVGACIFDIFGTTVDWRTSVSREAASFFKAKGIAGVDPTEFAVEWRTAGAVQNKAADAAMIKTMTFTAAAGHACGKNFKAMKEKDKNHPVEVTGRKLRKLMSWINSKEVD